MENKQKITKNGQTYVIRKLSLKITKHIIKHITKKNKNITKKKPNILPTSGETYYQTDNKHITKEKTSTLQQIPKTITKQ